ncbi:helix-turn-helix domain-containing protein (plasmid) [Acetobacter orientalis]|uniref:helix-turn-helix domain-containing protein n=1 Tax=Acetobacter orientalis TaxID=146474 RepID=UPI00386AB2C7
MTEDNLEADDSLLTVVGIRIKRIRVETGFSQQEFAKAAGMSNNYAWRVEAGRQNMSLKTLSRIAIALNISMADLLDGIDSDPATIGTRPYNRKKSC